VAAPQHFPFLFLLTTKKKKKRVASKTCNRRERNRKRCECISIRHKRVKGIRYLTSLVRYPAHNTIYFLLMHTSHINLLMDRFILTYCNMSYQILIEGVVDFDQAVAGDHAEAAESFACVDDDDHQQQLEQISRRKKKKKKGSKMNTRRFSDEQVRSLESMFESETKLEPRKKMQLARELGLQPRQVAIWFQNRRARWKTKQMEQKYKTLKASYDNLASSYESLKNERESLLLQVQTIFFTSGFFFLNHQFTSFFSFNSCRR